MERVYNFLKEAGTYYIATVDGDQPRVRPFGTVNLYDGKLYIQSGKKKDFAKQLEKNPKAELCAFTGGKWLRLSGQLIEDDNRAARVSMLEAYPELRSMYDPDDSNTLVYYFKNASAVISSFTEAPLVITF